MRTATRILAASVAALALACTPATSPDSGGASGAVTLSKNAAVIAVAGTETLTATVLPASANQGVSWKSSDSSVATVDSAGLVTGVKKGSATITATSSAVGGTATCAITVDSKLAGASTVVQKLPVLTVVPPNSLAARADSSRSLDSRVAQANYTVMDGSVANRAYNGSASLASSLSGSSSDLMDIILDNLNEELDLIKARIAAGLYNFDKSWEYSFVSYDQTNIYSTKVNMTELAERSYAIAKTQLTFSKDNGGDWDPTCVWNLYKITEGADGKLQVEAWTANSIKLASVGSKISTSVQDGATYYDYSYLRYDEATNVISMFSNAGSINFYYWYYPNGDERTIYSQYKSYADEEKTLYSEYCNFMWGDDVDGVASGFSRYKTLVYNNLMLNTSYNEDYFSNLDGHPGCYLGGKKYNTYEAVLDFASIPSFYYEWPIDLLAVVDQAKQIVCVPNESTIYNTKDKLFYLTPAGMTYDQFSPSGAGVALLGPVDYSATNDIGNVVSSTYQDYNSSTNSWSYEKTLYSYRNKSSGSNFQPDGDFTMDTDLAAKATALGAKSAGWMDKGKYYIDDIDAYQAKYAKIDMSLIEAISIDNPSISAR